MNNLDKLQNKVSGVIVIFNGRFAFSKILINELQKIYGNACEIVDLDEFERSYLASNPIQDGAEKNVLENYFINFLDDFYFLIRDKALTGVNVLVNAVPMLDKDREDGKFSNIFDGLKAIKVLLYCPLDILLDRLEDRNKAFIPGEYRDISLIIGQYMSLYKLQESESEEIIDKISSKDIKKVLRSAIDLFINELPDESKDDADKISILLEGVYKIFLQSFRLDELEDFSIVPKRHYDIVLNYSDNPVELVKEIVKLVKK